MALLPWLSTLAHRRALVPSKCGCVPGCVRDGCTFCCRELRCGALVGLQGELTKGVLYYQEGKIPSHSDLCSSTRKIDACTETHTDRLCSTWKKKNRDKKSHREPPVFGRKGQNGVAQARTPGAEDIICPLGPAPVVPMMVSEERPDSCRNISTRSGGTLGETAKRAFMVTDYPVSIPVCLPWGIIPSWSEAPKRGAETVPRPALAARGALLVKCGA